MHLSFSEWLGTIIIIYVIKSCVITPICDCIYNSYKVKHSVFKVETHNNKSEYVDVDCK